MHKAKKLMLASTILVLTFIIPLAVLGEDAKPIQILKRYADKKTGFFFEYPELAGWVMQETADVNAPGSVSFVNKEINASLSVGHMKLPAVTPDLSIPGMLDAAVADIFGSYKKNRPDAKLLSSRIVTNPNNKVKGVEMVYTDKIHDNLLKIKDSIFFKGTNRYSVTAIARDKDFDRVDKDFFAVVLKSLRF
ncbi:MAG: hypothetical protein HZA10_10560 [Nitrospirae bacterium]|nr:hypothetical protein [Nitrospirota bacterium]